MDSEELQLNSETETETSQTIETVPDDLSDITLESHEDYWTLADGSIIDRDHPLPVEIIDPNSVDISVSEEEVPEIEVHYLEEATAEEPVILDDLRKFEHSPSRSTPPDFKNLWKLSINQEDYNILFPANADLEVVDGKLYNVGTSSITGIVLDSSWSDSSYVHRTFTILPVSSSSTQTTVYRNGSRQYFTDYSPGTNNNLISTVSYIQSTVVERPLGWSLTPKDWVICGLLLFSVLVSIIGGLVRR